MVSIRRRIAAVAVAVTGTCLLLLLLLLLLPLYLLLLLLLLLLLFQFDSIQFDSIEFNSVQFDSIRFDSIYSRFTDPFVVAAAALTVLACCTVIWSIRMAYLYDIMPSCRRLLCFIVLMKMNDVMM